MENLPGVNCAEVLDLKAEQGLQAGLSSPPRKELTKQAKANMLHPIPYHCMWVFVALLVHCSSSWALGYYSDWALGYGSKKAMHCVFELVSAPQQVHSGGGRVLAVDLCRPSQRHLYTTHHQCRGELPGPPAATAVPGRPGRAPQAPRPAPGTPESCQENCVSVELQHDILVWGEGYKYILGFL